MAPHPTKYTTNGLLIRLLKQLVKIIINSLDGNWLFKICYPELNAIIITPIYDHSSLCGRICAFCVNIYFLRQLGTSNINILMVFFTWMNLLLFWSLNMNTNFDKHQYNNKQLIVHTNNVKIKKRYQWPSDLNYLFTDILQSALVGYNWYVIVKTLNELITSISSLLQND